MSGTYEVAYVKLAQMLLPGEKMASSHEELFSRCEERVRTLRALGVHPDEKRLRVIDNLMIGVRPEYRYGRE